MPVPTIDLRAAYHDASALALVDTACRDHGFFILTNHGMDNAIDKMWSASRNFFKHPVVFKRTILRNAEQPLGYYDRELTKRLRDQKEVFDYMQPRADGSDRNQWPAGEEGFRQILEDFFRKASLVATATLS